MLIKPRFEAFTLHIILLASLGTFIPWFQLLSMWGGAVGSFCHRSAPRLWLAPIWVGPKPFFQNSGAPGLRCAFRAGMRAGAYFHRSILSWVAYRW